MEKNGKIFFRMVPTGLEMILNSIQEPSLD